MNPADRGQAFDIFDQLFESLVESDQLSRGTYLLHPGRLT